MSNLQASVTSACGKSLQATIVFLHTQIDLLHAIGESAEISSTITKFTDCLIILDAQEEEETNTKPLNSPTQKESCFPFAIGIVARTAMTELFRKNMLSDDDIRFLLSEDAQKAFVCRKVEFLRPYQTGDKSERLDESGRDRYYSAPILERDGHKYYLTKELTKEKLGNLLDWIYSQGINEKELIELCGKYDASHAGEKPKAPIQEEIISREKVQDAETATKQYPKSFPLLKAVKPGKYVRFFFDWLASSGSAIPKQFLEKGLSSQWCDDNLGLWLPLFATEETMTEEYRKRYWQKPYAFANVSLYVNAQWYDEKRGGIRQKQGFDQFAIELARACGLSFEPYPLPRIPENSELPLIATTTDIEAREGTPSYSPDGLSESITIHVSSKNKKSFHIKQ